MPDHSRSVSGNGVLGYTICKYTEAETIDRINRTDRIHPLIKIPVTRFFVRELGLGLIDSIAMLASHYPREHNIPTNNNANRQCDDS